MGLGDRLRKQLEEADTELLRGMMRLMAGMLMDAEVAAICGAGYRERSEERINSRNGHRQRPWDTRVGSIDPAIPKLREGSYFPAWLLQAPPAGGAGAGERGGRLVPGRRLPPPGGQTHEGPGDRGHIQVPGIPHGPGAGWDG